MGFFQGAYDFEISGGRFYDIRGDQINRTEDSSMRIGGTGNRTQISPNLSRQDNRAYNHQEEQQYAAYCGPEDSQHSTYPGYGQAPPTAPGMPSQAYPPGQPAIDPQLYHQYIQWCEWKRWQEWQLFQQQQQQHSQQDSPDAQLHEFTDSQQQPSQTFPTATHQPQPAQNTPAGAQLLQDSAEDSAVEDLRHEFQRQHIGEQPEYAYAYRRGQAQS